MVEEWDECEVNDGGASGSSSGPWAWDLVSSSGFQMGGFA